MLRGHRSVWVAYQPPRSSTQSIAQRSLCAPAKFGECTRSIEAPARLAIGLRGIPPQSAFVANHGSNLPEQVANADLLAGTEIHEFRFRIFLRRGDDAFRRILNVKELARGAPRSP